MSSRISIFAVAAPLVLAGLLAGCGLTPRGDIAREAVKASGAQAYDEGLATAEWFVCQAASVGSVQRRYGAAPELATAWRSLCLGDGRPVFSPDTGS